MKKKKEPNGFAKLRRSTALPKWRFFIPNVPFRFRLFLSLIAASLYINSLPAQDSQYDPLHGRGEKEYAEGSYALAHETYEKCAALKLDPTVKRWVDFRLADTLWRAQAGSQTPDASNYEKAQDALQSLIRDRNREEDHDLVWAEAHESLGDFYWLRNDSRNWGTGWNFYQFALEWWAGSPDIESARERYIKIVKKIARPSWVEPYYYYGYYGNQAPMNVLENYLKIAQSANDKAQAHYLIAMTLRNQGGDWEQVRRVPEEFEAALEAGRGGDWYDDALFYYADWMATRGRARMNDEGQWIQEPDYVRALELYRRLLNELKKGETRYYDQAKAQIENITGAQLGLGVSNIFPANAEIQFYLNWRNIKHLDLSLAKVSLTGDLKFPAKEPQQSYGDWLQKIETGGKERIKSWTKETGDKGIYLPGGETVTLEEKLPMGAYIIEARGEGKTARDLILVTDAALVLKTSGRQALAYFADVNNGAPVPEAEAKLWERYWDGSSYRSIESTATTGKDGLAIFKLSDLTRNNNRELFAAAANKDRQAFSAGQSYFNQPAGAQWKIYVFTDRPAYRPEDEVKWKFTARQSDGGAYSTPADKTVEYEITDPQGAKVMADKVKLNAFGSAWGTLPLKKEMPLGQYQINFWDAGRKNSIGGAPLFRLEEYKLPEFKVSVQTPEVDGKKKAFRLGEAVEVNIQADYYFGGAVGNADVEVIVRQNPFYHYWHLPRDYPWFYEDMGSPYRSYWGAGSVIKQEKIKTDATGKATLSFDTPRGGYQDFEYQIEARVTDSSRREITANGTVRVTRQRYYVNVWPEHNIYRPQDKVKVNFKAIDANDQPVQTEGKVKITRDYWYEIWIDPTGKEVKGNELKALRNSSRIFPPPPPDPNGPDWKLKFRGYQHDDILTRTVKTDALGEAELTFTSEREGYYRVTWVSQDPGFAPIKGETTVWVARNSTTELGYRYNGIEIIADKDTFRVGQKAPVMLNATTNDRYVLFCIEGEELQSYQVVHMEGTTKLVELEIGEQHVPNIYLTAAMMSDRQIFVDSKQVVVPPTRNFLEVKVEPDRIQYQPREEGTFKITTLNDEGKPVSAEVALGVVDESVFYIQQDFAGDPRQFFYGAKRGQLVQTQSTFSLKGYLRDEDREDDAVGNRRLNAKTKDFRRRAFVGGNFEERSDLFYEAGQVLDSVSAGGIGEGSDEDLKKADRPVGAGGRVIARKEAAAESKVMAQALPASAPAPAENEMPAVQVRTDFRASIFWQPDVVTDNDGRATIKVTYPDSLTGWKTTARVAAAGNQFGIGSASTRTKQPLIARLECPRFFVVGDLAAVSAVFNNNTSETLTVSPALEASGVVVSGLMVKGEPVKGEAGPVKVAPNSEARVDWAVSIQKPGEAKLKITGRAKPYADAMEKTIPVFEHGIEKFVSKSGKVRGGNVTIKLDIPKERKPESTVLNVQLTPSLAVTMLDAIPYLIDYPYGCTEQTMSRFLPAAITAKTLKDLGLKPEDVAGKIFGGIEHETADKTHKNDKKYLERLDEIAKKGLDRIYDFQHSDGGWGWWKEGESDHYMTAYVIWGLTLAHEAGLDPRVDVAERGAQWLDLELVEEEENYDRQAWMLHALAVYRASFPARVNQPIPEHQAKALDNLWKNRDRLNAYTRALLTLAANAYGDKEKAQTLIQNLANGVKKDNAPDTSILVKEGVSSNESVIGTAHWGEDGVYWRWSDGGVEATAFALRAMMAVDPKNPLVEPTMNWLVKNRRGAQWSNTRDTAIVVLAMNDYLRASGELSADVEYELSVNGNSVASKKITAADVLNAPSLFPIDLKNIKDGANEIRIVRRGGESPIYFSAAARFFSLEEPIKAAGNEIFVRRTYYKISNKPTLLKGFVSERSRLRDGGKIASGDRVETLITVETKNNYEYLLFEDLKPAGLEATQIQSGQSLNAAELKSKSLDERLGAGEKDTGLRDPGDYTGRTRWVYQELRDRKVALFLDKLPQGVWEMRYEMRAEAPGEFHALPVIGHAMYVPEIRCNGEEMRVKVVE